MVLCALDDITGKAVLQFPTKAARPGWTTCWAGTAPTTTRTASSPRFRGLVSRLMEDALEDLRYSLGRF